MTDAGEIAGGAAVGALIGTCAYFAGWSAPAVVFVALLDGGLAWAILRMQR